MSLIIFWIRYIILVSRLLIWVAKHPLRVGASILFLYIIGRGIVRVGIRFVIGVFLFLTGVSGIIVAFLYVVALCPNPVFKAEDGAGDHNGLVLGSLICGVLGPIVGLVLIYSFSFNTETGKIGENYQWFRDPTICGGLAELIPFLGVLLFLCMVRVVVLCGQQKQCLGGHRYMGVKRSYR